jgi:hypothetical protein
VRVPGRVAAALGVVVAGVLGIGALLILRSDDSSAKPDGRARVDLVVLGDSFVEHSRDQIAAYATSKGLTNTVQGLGGTAMCNWTRQFAEQARLRPKVLVLSYAGNDIPHTCFNPTAASRSPEAVAAGYRQALDRVIAQFAGKGVELYVVLPPPIRDQQFEQRAAAMRVMYRQAAADHPGLHLIDSATTLDPGHKGFQLTLPCQAFDKGCPASGRIVVRRPDGIHVTPAGAERYARAIVDAIGGR